MSFLLKRLWVYGCSMGISSRRIWRQWVGILRVEKIWERCSNSFKYNNQLSHFPKKVRIIWELFDNVSG